VVQLTLPLVIPSPAPLPQLREASPRLPVSATFPPVPGVRWPAAAPAASGKITSSWVRHPRFDATTLICPAGIVAGETPSSICAPKGAVPPIILDIPISASVTFTTRPGNDPGAEHVVCAKRYPAPPPIIPGPDDEPVDRPPAPIIPDPVELPEPQPDKAKAATVVASATNLRHTTSERIHPDDRPHHSQRSPESLTCDHGEALILGAGESAGLRPQQLIGRPRGGFPAFDSERTSWR